MSIGLKIRTARLAKGLTQEELGDIIGVQKSAVAKYENGRIVNIKRSTLKKISDALGIPPHELVFDAEKEKPAGEGELSDSQKKLIAFAQTVPEDKAELVLKIMKSIVGAD